MPLQIKVSVKKPILAKSTTVTPGTIPYMHKEDWWAVDKPWDGGLRKCVPCPAVWVLKDDPHALLNKQWQYYLLAINPSMEPENVYLLLDAHLAFANGTGFRGDVIKADYFHNKNLGAKNPALDKVRTCSRNVLTGVEVSFSLKALQKALRGVLWSGRAGVSYIRSAILTKVLKVKTFDSRSNPPLKPGRVYPKTISEINPDDYLFMPQFNREMFLVADIVNATGETVQFPRGGLYSWTNDNTPYSFLPHISNHGYGSVLYTLENLIKLPMDAPVPSVYRRN